MSCGSSFQEEIESPYYPLIPAPPEVTFQNFFPDQVETEPKKLLKGPPGLTQNPILRKLAEKALKNQNYYSLDSRSNPPSVSGSSEIDNPLLPKIPFKGPPTSTLQTANVAPNPIYISEKLVETTTSNSEVLTNMTSIPIQVSMPVEIECLASTQVRYTKA